jgi:predicted metal-dependent enzyme (double-stranded beta helix superfamily)
LSAEQSEPDPNQYRQHMLYLDPQDRFSIVALVWMPGQQTPIHDHIAWCVFGVHQGTEYEVNYRLCHGPEGEYLVPVGGSTNVQGSVAALIPPGDIHHVFNRGCGPAISLHVYGANIASSRSSILRRYDVPTLPSMEQLAELPASAPLPHVAVQAHPWARAEPSALWL